MNSLIFAVPLQISINGSFEPSSNETTKDDTFKFYFNEEEINDFPLLIERLLTSNDENFPVIMDFLTLNGIVGELEKISFT